MKEDLQAAVALKYVKGMEAPFISASAKGELAEQLVGIAEENGIPIVQNPPLAQILSLQEIGACIPESTWEIVANIFVAVVEIEKKI